MIEAYAHKNIGKNQTVKAWVMLAITLQRHLPLLQSLHVKKISIVAAPDGHSTSRYPSSHPEVQNNKCDWWTVRCYDSKGWVVVTLHMYEEEGSDVQHLQTLEQRAGWIAKPTGKTLFFREETNSFCFNF
ncbi:hypothetical protein C8J56DRAFT_1162698 [Mycena floridula]|nr:hypothetical protein C8J56DRAFT_1162698 [Mycena floridula]